MNKFNTSSINSGEEQEHSASSPSLQYRSPTTGYDDRLIELEMENARLNRLVAELLVKNQQLRRPD
jgi:hypothetical protein